MDGKTIGTYYRPLVFRAQILLNGAVLVTGRAGHAMR